MKFVRYVFHGSSSPCPGGGKRRFAFGIWAAVLAVAVVVGSGSVALAEAHNITITKSAGTTGQSVDGITITANPTTAEKDTEVTLTVEGTIPEGYEFVYTYDNSNTALTFEDGDNLKFKMPEDSDINITATLTPITYTVTLTLAESVTLNQSDGWTEGNNNKKSKTYTIESETFTLPDATKSDSTFTGWKKDGNGTVLPSVTIEKGSTGNLEYTASFVDTSNAITITFEANSGTGTMTAQTVGSNEETQLKANTFTRTGYKFAGWADADDNQVDYQDEGTVTTSTALTLKAVWEDYTSMWGVSDNGEINGSQEHPYEINTVAGWRLLATEAETETYGDKYFKLTEDIGSTTDDDNKIAEMVGTAEHPFKGHFDGNGNTITVTLTGGDTATDFVAPFAYVDGATIENLTVAGTITTSGATAGGIVGKSSNTTTITECTFTGKIVDASSENSAKAAGFVGENAGTLTISGVYAPTALADTGEKAPATANAATFALTGTGGTAPTEEGLKTCYYTEALGTTQGTQLFTVSGAGGITVTVADGNTGGLISNGKIYVLKADDVLTLTLNGGANGYETTAGTLEAADTNYKLTFTALPTANVVISAKAATPEEVKYMDGDNEESTTDYVEFTEQTALTGDKIYVLKESKSVEGITLNGDVKIVLCNGATLTITQSGITKATGAETATLTTYVQKEESGKEAGKLAVTGDVKDVTVNGRAYDASGNVTYTVTFNSNEGSEVDAQNITYTYAEITGTPNKTATKPADPTKDSYTFAGWYSDAELTTEYDFATVVTESITLYAKWTENGSSSETFTPTDANTPEVVRHSMVLGGQISLMFYVYFPTADMANSATMKFDVGGDTSQNSQDGVGKSDKTYAIGDYTLYGFECYLTSVQMADTITPTLTYTDTDSKQQTITLTPYTAQEYLAKLVAVDATTYGQAAIDLGAAIQHYGYYVQVMLQKANGWEFGEDKDHKQMTAPTTAITPIGVTDVSQYAIKLTPKDNADGTYDLTSDANIEDMQFSLLLEKETTIRLYMKPEAEGTTFTATLSNGDTHTALAEDEAIASGKKTGYYYIDIENIPAHKLSTTYTVAIKATPADASAATEFNVNVSALSYVHSVLNSGNTYSETSTPTKSEMENAVTAIYNYSQKTEAYNEATKKEYVGVTNDESYGD